MRLFLLKDARVRQAENQCVSQALRDGVANSEDRRLMSNEYSLLTVLEAASPRSRPQRACCLLGTGFPLRGQCLLAASSRREPGGVPWGPVIRALLQAWGSTLATPLTSQRPRLLTPSPWGWDFSMWILGTHSDRSSLWRAAWQPVHSWRPLRPARGPERVLRCRGLCSGLA